MKNRQRTLRILAIIFLFWPVMTSQVEAMGFDRNSEVTVEIVSDERGPLPKYDAGFGNEYNRRSYVAALDGERYRIWVSNRSGNRVGLVIAVDGRNIISGEQSQLGPHERMYILGPYQTGQYEGWRTGRNLVNRFYFTGMSDSYAAAWGDYTAMGVIAVAVYQSRHEDRSIPREFQRNNSPQERRLDRPMARGQREAPGTGYGESEWSPSRPVEFFPQDRPAVKEFIKYEWYATLCKRGIIDCQRPRGGNRFWPEWDHDRGFAPPPPRWPFLRP